MKTESSETGERCLCLGIFLVSAGARRLISYIINNNSEKKVAHVRRTGLFDQIERGNLPPLGLG
jgi:hypothetical protein